MSFHVALAKLAYAGPDPEERRAKRMAEARFKKLRRDLKSSGVMIGAHKRIAIPKSALTEADLKKHLGFVPVTIAVPEAGQNRFVSFRHPRNNYHLHDHDTHWTMHKDNHPAATMVLKRVFAPAHGKGKRQIRTLGDKIRHKTRLAGRAAHAVASGVPHVVTEGIPGMYYYTRGRITGAGSTLQNVLQNTPKHVHRRIRRWRPSIEARREQGQL